jgi:hypothetical protein
MSTDLIAEIRRAREAVRYQEAKTSEAGFTLRMAKEQEKKARAELDQLLDELETGESRYTLPGFDRLEIPGGNGAAKDRPGDPTEFVPPSILPWQDFYFTSSDVDRVLTAACRSLPKNCPDPWPEFREHGCDDAKILEILRAIWPSRRPRFEREPDEPMGYVIRGGADPALWIGTRKTVDQPPLLEGLALAARVRVVLDLPPVPVPVPVSIPDPEPEPEPQAKPAPARFAVSIAKPAKKGR